MKYEFITKNVFKNILTSLTAKWVKFDNKDSSIESSDVQGAIDELKAYMEQLRLDFTKPEVELPPVLDIVGKTEAEIINMTGSTSTLTIDGSEWYVLDILNKTTYSTIDGEVGEVKKAALLWAKEPWKTTLYTFSNSRTDGYDKSNWSGSDLQVDLEREVNINTTLSSLALRVDTSMSYNTSGIITKFNSYDRFFPLRYDEYISYIGSGGARGMDTSGDIGNSINRWLRTPYNSVSVYMHNSSNGKTSYYGADSNRGVRPAMWVEIGESGEATVSEIKYASVLQDMGIESISGESDFTTIIDMGISIN